MLKITEKAHAKILDFIKEDNLEGQFLRVGVKGGGCAGFEYDLLFTEIKNDLDEEIDFKDFKVIIDQLSLQYIDGTTIDYLEGLVQSGFKFLNDNIKSTCGCDSSFSF